MTRVKIGEDLYDPYKVLCISNRNFTVDELKKNYKSLALQLHPDKNKLSPETSKQVFQVLTQCYKALLSEYDAKQSEKPFHELKSAYKSQIASPSPPFSSSSKFDMDRFNRVFLDNRIETVHDSGYENWMKKYDVDDPKVLAELENAQKKKEMHLVKYREPAALHIVKSKGMGFEELGVDNIQDFSKDPAATDRKQLAFTDYRVAHTTTRIIDPDLVKQRKEYKSVQELEKDRAGISFEMSPVELQRHHATKRRQEVQEQQRVEALRTYDAKINDHHDRVHQLMLRLLK